MPWLRLEAGRVVLRFAFKPYRRKLSLRRLRIRPNDPNNTFYIVTSGMVPSNTPQLLYTQDDGIVEISDTRNDISQDTLGAAI
jgi:hypothetical protein